MHKADTDKDWEHFGHTDPYWAVITHERYRRENLDGQAQQEFFASGEKYITETLGTIRTHLDAGFQPVRALDFGCGVGRLALPLARRCESVVGVDVSESMIREARAQSEARQVTNISWVKGDDELSRVSGGFDLINSCIVFQHIPCHRGQKLLKRLLELLNEGGVGVIHLTYSRASLNADPFAAWPSSAPVYSATPFKDLRCYLSAMRRVIRRQLRKLLRREKAASGQPTMQMNPYTLNPLFHLLQRAGVRNMYIDFADHGGEYGLTLFFRKSTPNPA